MVGMWYAPIFINASLDIKNIRRGFFLLNVILGGLADHRLHQ